MKTIVIASKNRHKILEITEIMKEFSIKWLTLEDLPDMPNVEEDGKTLEENSLKKAKTIALWCGLDCIADDTGLEIEALNGEPGVNTARFAHLQASDDENIAKTLELMRDKSHRQAQFKTVITYYTTDNNYQQFVGTVQGEISCECCGEEGFGYDPIFYIPELKKTLAELGKEKHRHSHRARALAIFSKNVKI